MNITTKTLEQGKLSAIYISDLHLECDRDQKETIKFFDKKEADIVIIAGDLSNGTDGEFFIRHLTSLGYIVLYVLGNHEFWYNDIDNLISEWRNISSKIDNFYFLEKDIITINDVDFIGACLWTSVGTKSLDEPIDWFVNKSVRDAKDFEFINKLKPDTMKHLFYQSKEFIFNNLNSNRKQVVITHYVPSEMSSDIRFHNNKNENTLFFSELGNDIAYSDILFWIHGHTHDSYNYFINNTNILCNPRGYYNQNMINTDFSWNDFKIKIDL